MGPLVLATSAVAFKAKMDPITYRIKSQFKKDSLEKILLIHYIKKEEDLMNFPVRLPIVVSLVSKYLVLKSFFF